MDPSGPQVLIIIIQGGSFALLCYLAIVFMPAIVKKHTARVDKLTEAWERQAEKQRVSHAEEIKLFRGDCKRHNKAVTQAITRLSAALDKLADNGWRRKRGGDPPSSGGT